MGKYIAIILAILGLGVILFTYNKRDENIRHVFSFPALPSFSLDSLKISNPNDIAVAEETWSVFQTYLGFAKEHNLAGIQSLSHQMSPACKDPAQIEQCFALMDSVYAIAGAFELNAFSNVEYDERQIILYTDYEEIKDDAGNSHGQVRTVIYFTKDEHDNTKVLGMRLCFADKNNTDDCIITDPEKRDQDSDGWWDNVESLFYTNTL